MYEILAVLGGFALIYSAVAGGVERTWISGPIVFVALGNNRNCSWRWRS
jgi:hypothetical protein